MHYFVFDLVFLKNFFDNTNMFYTKFDKNNLWN